MTALLFRDDAYLQSCEASVTKSEAGMVELNSTVFYPEGGGQPGDQGTLVLPDGRSLKVIDTKKGESADSVRHILAPGEEVPAVGSTVTARIDWGRRHRLMRMHSCLHLLCAVVKGDVTGGQIGDGKGRLDFNLPDGAPEKDQVTAALNRLIAENHPLSQRWISDEELAAKPELVRTMSVRPPSGAGRVRLMEVADVDLQPCGGTHVRSTAEIGPVAVTKIENKGKMNRRFNLAFAE